MPRSDLSVIVGGFTELAQALRSSGVFKNVYDVPDTATFQKEAAAGKYPSRQNVVLVFADSMPSTVISLDYILSRLVASDYPLVMVNVSGKAHDWARRFPKIGTLKGGTTVNSVLAAISGLTGHILEAVGEGHAPIHPGGPVPHLPSAPAAPAPTPRKPTPPPVRRASDAYTGIAGTQTENRSDYTAPANADGWQDAPQQNTPQTEGSRPSPPSQMPARRADAPSADPTGQPPPAPAPRNQTPMPAPRAVSHEPDPTSSTETHLPASPGKEAATPAPSPHAAPETDGWTTVGDAAGESSLTPPAPATAPQQRTPGGYEPEATPAVSSGGWDTPAPQPPAPRLPVARGGSGSGHAPKRAKVITVAAAKGGTGKSSVSLNIAAFLGLRTSQQVAIIDLNIQQADVGKYIQEYRAKTVVDLVANLTTITPDNIRQYMAYSQDGDFYAVLGPHNPNYADPGILNSNVYRTILEHLRQTFDYIIIDTPVAEKYHDLVTNFAVPEADQVVFVVAPNWTTIHNARMYLKMMTREPDGPRLSPDKVGWILNQYRGDVDCDEDQAIQAMSDYRYFGHLPYTAEWQRANNNFELIVTQRYDDINLAFARMLTAVTGVDFPVRASGNRGNARKGNSLWDRLRGK
ncbi:MAG: AAA family ATPase [Maioricimonas sp. JB049]